MPGKRSTTQRARPAARSLLPLMLGLLTGCEACKPDETLAEMTQPRRARLVRQHKLGRWFENVTPTVLELDGVEQQYEACEGSTGEAELHADASGTVFVFRCHGQPWKVARVVAERLFPDCPPSGTTAEQILAAAPKLEQAAVEMLRCREAATGLFLGYERFINALVVELGAEATAEVLMAVEEDADPKDEWTSTVQRLQPEPLLAVQQRLCPVLRAAESRPQAAKRAASLCPLGGPWWTEIEPQLPQLLQSVDGRLREVAEVGLIARVRDQPKRAGQLACTALERALLAPGASWSDAALTQLLWAQTLSKEPCVGLERSLQEAPPCPPTSAELELREPAPLQLLCDSKPCSHAELIARFDQLSERALAPALPLGLNWTSDAGDGHAGYVVAPRLMGATLLARAGSYEQLVKQRCPASP